MESDGQQSETKENVPECVPDQQSPASYGLRFRYRHLIREITFYEPPKAFSELDEEWQSIHNATKEALSDAFGEVCDYMIGVSEFIHGPVIPISILIKQPSSFTDCVLDIILSDDCPFLVDLQTPTTTGRGRGREVLKNQSKINNKDPKLRQLLKEIEMEYLEETLIKEHQIDYKTFLALEKSDLKEMNIPIGYQKKILNKIQQVRQERKENEKNNKKIDKWIHYQRQLSLPLEVPLKVEPIPYTRLFNQNFHQSLDEFLKLHLRHYGYSVLKLTPSMMEKVNYYKTMWNNFFDKDIEYKNECTLDPKKYGGYGGYYNEKNRQMFQVSPIMPGCTPPWPKDDPDFEEMAIEMFRFLEQIAKTCLQALARSLNIDPNLFLDVCETEFSPRLFGSSIRVCRYKKKKKNVGSLCFEHSDTSILTLGFVSNVPELQFYDKAKGQWVSVEDDLDESHTVVFVGRVLSRMTAGYFQPAYHRVFRKQNEERLSFPFFLRPREDGVFQIEKTITTSNIAHHWCLPPSVAPEETMTTHPHMWR